MPKRREMESWGDVNAAFNGLVREGVLATFRTGLQHGTAPAIRVVPGEGVEPNAALDRARAALTGAFASARVALAD